MKGLLIKDLYTLFGQMKFFLILLAVWAILPNSTGGLMPVLLGAMMPYTALAYDERSHWNTFVAMLPVSPLQVVAEKYLLGYLLSAGAAILCCVGQLISVLAFSEESSLAVLPIIYCVANLLMCASLPMMFRWGVEKGRVAFLLLVACFTTVCVILLPHLIETLQASGNLLLLLTAAVVVITALLSVLSIRLSVRGWKKQLG